MLPVLDKFPQNHWSKITDKLYHNSFFKQLVILNLFGVAPWASVGGVGDRFRSIRRATATCVPQFRTKGVQTM